jgi:2-(1,2-epoxy-1,2-dihydrophenyl)acetyl-CoA isomerase
MRVRFPSPALALLPGFIDVFDTCRSGGGPPNPAPTPRDAAVQLGARSGRSTETLQVSDLQRAQLPKRPSPDSLATVRTLPSADPVSPPKLVALARALEASVKALEVSWPMPLRTSLEHGVLELVLDRPERYNAIDSDVRDALIDAFDSAPERTARVIVMRGEGKGFCAGADLKEAGARVAGVDLERRMATSSYRLARSVLLCRVPIVAAVHGACAGIGLTLALGADVCVAADDARFSAPFVPRGLVPDGAIARLLPRIIGYARSREFLLLGQVIEAKEALTLGMIARVVPATELADAARASARELASLPADAVAYTKQLLNRSFELDLESFLFEERAIQALLSTREPDVD